MGANEYEFIFLFRTGDFGEKVFHTSGVEKLTLQLNFQSHGYLPVTESNEHVVMLRQQVNHGRGRSDDVWRRHWWPQENGPSLARCRAKGGHHSFLRQEAEKSVPLLKGQ